MSTTYFALHPKKTFEQLREDLKENKVGGLRHAPNKNETDTKFCITDGESFAWVEGSGKDWDVTRYGIQTNINDIIYALVEYSGALGLPSEHDLND